jgi:molecular chaperone DnaK (HSP70)
MKQDAEANAESDKVSRERAEKLNEADGMIFQTETQLKELGEKLSDENKVAVEYALTELRMAHQSQDIQQFKLHLITSMLLGKLLLKQCMLKENKVKLCTATR